jgi:proline iminopeptidase
MTCPDRPACLDIPRILEPKRVLSSCLVLLWAALLLSCGSQGGAAPNGERVTPGRESQKLMLSGADGIQLRVVLAGQGPLLLVPTPGWGPSLELYERTLRPLEESFTVAYLDTRGSGESTDPGPQVMWGLERFAADLDRVRAGLGRKGAYVLGHGSGCAIALTFALAYASHCNGLILTAATASRSDEWRRRMLARVAERVKRDPAFARRARQLAILGQSGPPLDDGEARAVMLARLPTLFADVKKIGPYRADFEASSVRASALQPWESVAGRFDFGALLENVECPVLIINGEFDHLAAPEDAAVLDRGLPSSTSLIAEGAGHFVWIEKREWFFARVRDWLQAQRSDDR